MNKKQIYKVRVNGELVFSSYDAEEAYEYASEVYEALDAIGEEVVDVRVNCGTRSNRILSLD